MFIVVVVVVVVAIIIIITHLHQSDWRKKSYCKWIPCRISSWVIDNWYCIHSNMGMYTLKTPRSAWPGKRSVGARLHSGSTMTRKSVNLTRNLTQSWVNLTALVINLTDFRVTRMEFGPNGPFSESRLTRVFSECTYKAVLYVDIKRLRNISLDKPKLELHYDVMNND